MAQKDLKEHQKEMKKIHGNIPKILYGFNMKEIIRNKDGTIKKLKKYWRK